MTPDASAYKKSSFGPAFLFLDKRRREALAVYYAFCRLMDDIADESGIEDRSAQLTFWREEIARVFEKKATTQLGKELQQITDEFKMTSDRFLQLIDGMEADVQGRRYNNFEELETYLWNVAGIVGLATLDILGVKGKKAQLLAQSLGFAVQITNIVRDVHDDAAMGRVYIPTDLLAQKKLTYENVLQNTHPQELATVLAVLAQRAQSFYRQAEDVMKTLPARKMLPCRIMGLVYQQNLAKIERKDFQFEKTIKLSKAEKIKYALYALCKTPIF